MKLRVTTAADYLSQYPSGGSSIELTNSLHAYRLDDFLLIGHYGLPVSPTYEVIRDRLINNDMEDQIKRIDWVELSSVPFYRVDGIYLPLYGDWSENFWHWMMENLPSVMLAEDSGYNGKYIIPPASYARESVELLGVHPERILEYDGGHWSVETLYLVERIHGWALDKCPHLIDLIRRKLIDAVRHIVTETSWQRTYISRNKLGKNRRIVVNEDALLNVLAHYGFKTVYLEELSLVEQIAIMVNTTALITPHGAGTFYTLLMPPKSLVLELFAPTYINPVMLPVLDFLDHKYYMIPSYLNADVNAEPSVYSFGWDIEAFLPVIELTLKRELNKLNSLRYFTQESPEQ